MTRGLETIKVGSSEWNNRPTVKAAQIQYSRVGFATIVKRGRETYSVIFVYLGSHLSLGCQVERGGGGLGVSENCIYYTKMALSW